MRLSEIFDLTPGSLSEVTRWKHGAYFFIEKQWNMPKALMFILKRIEKNGKQTCYPWILPSQNDHASCKILKQDYLIEGTVHSYGHNSEEIGTKDC